MARIVCLANSYKRGGRCIAGIDLDTGQWVRPIGNGHEGAIGEERIINGAEPKILDVLEIQLDGDADDRGCQPENKVFKSSPWRKVGTMSVDEIIKYTENSHFLLHNHDKKVLPSYFRDEIPSSQWKSLQLIQVENSLFSKKPRGKIKCDFIYSSQSYTLPAPCPEADSYLRQGGSYILTISLAGPFAREIGDEEYCYKMVAGAIKL